jgi:flagellar assembly factor FliW
VEKVASTQFGVLFYLPEQVIHFPGGLPAFESETRFLPVENAATAPVVFLQSLSDPDLAFITLPAQVIEAGYGLTMSPEDMAALELAPGSQPEIGGDVLCLAIVTIVAEGEPTANLMAPVVINLRTRQALQAIRPDREYSHQHPIAPGDTGGAACS